MQTSQRSVKFGVVFTPEYTNIKELRDMFWMVEDMGFDSAWTSDHFITSTRKGGGPRYDGWVSLTYLLSQTERIRGGPTIAIGIGDGWLLVDDEARISRTCQKARNGKSGLLGGRSVSEIG